MKIELNPGVDKYLMDGCMRCKYGGTPQCKVNTWREELENLRQIALESGLKEEVKWGIPVYTHKGKNILSVSALKNHALMGFFNGVLFTDSEKILGNQANILEARVLKFTNVSDIEAKSEVIAAYIKEAVKIEESGRKVEIVREEIPLPEELEEAFAEDPDFRKAFYQLTPGRQRAYLIHFGQSKVKKTRLARIEKYKQQIFDGIGLYDHYSKR